MKRMKNNLFYFISILVIFVLPSCKEYTPKPKGHPYFELSKPDYVLYDQSPAFSFLLSEQGEIQNKRDSLDIQWFDICYPGLNASIHCSYIPFSPNNFSRIDEESRNFVYFHIRKAQQFQERQFENPKQNVYGLVYKIDGDVVSPIQFTLTDSTTSFFRGALYFNSAPQQDSIAPVVDYINQDIQTMIESFRWKM